MPIRLGTNMAAGNQQGTSVTEFCYKSVNIPLEELTKIKVIFFLMDELFRQQNTLKQDTFLTYMTPL